MQFLQSIKKVVLGKKQHDKNKMDFWLWRILVYYWRTSTVVFVSYYNMSIMMFLHEPDDRKGESPDDRKEIQIVNK